MQKEHDLISLYLEAETSKIRAELLKENHTLRLELEALKTTSTILLNDVQGKIENAEDKITEKSINKTLAIIQQIKNWIGIAALVFSAIFGISAWLGYKSLTESLTTSFKDKVTHWMRFDDEESGGRKALDELRTEAILNAYMIRLTRDYSRANESLFPVNGPEEKRLLEVLQTPDTTYANFSDALTIIIKNRGPFRGSTPDDLIGKQIALLMKTNGISPHKRGLILERLKGDEALLPYSAEILNNVDYNVYTRIIAFENIKRFDPKAALIFASQKLENVEPRMREELIFFLAEQSRQYDPILSYADELIEKKPEYWESRTIELASRLGEIITTTVNAQPGKMAELYSKIIDQGARIVISDDRFGPKHIAIELDGAITLLRKPATLLKSNTLIKATIASRPMTIEWLVKAIDFFQVSDEGNPLSTLILTPTPNALIQTKSHKTLSQKSIVGDIWLRTEELPDGKDLTGTWRDSETGVVHTEQIVSISGLADCDYRLSFDANLLKSLSYEYRSPIDSL
ncbi:hypothetical protein [Pseudomonas helvetica]|uniref:hypothetical protein n=1 Tax=Pseudomonas helvetica TaxID=3136738 RepID=UPI00326489D1